MNPGAVVAIAAAALAAASAVAALREGIHSWPAARSWLAEALSPLTRAATEGYEPTDRERRRLWLVGSLACGIVLLAAFGFGPYLAIAGAVPLASDRLIAGRRRRYRAAFEAGLGPWARALGDAVGAGQLVRRAVIDSAGAASAEVAGELARVRADLEAGAALDLALDRLRRRVASPGLGSIVGALDVAARSGGEVGPLLHRFAAANDERVAVLADARSATAQARMTGVVVAAMPAAGLAFTELSSPGFAGAMLADSIARLLLSASLLMQLGAFAAIRRISRVRR